MRNAFQTERRKAERSRVFFGAAIVDAILPQPLECQVRSLSDCGARLSPSVPQALPWRFDLNIPAKSRSWPVEVIWMRDGEIGVKFVDASPAAANVVELPNLERARQRIAAMRDRLAGEAD